MAEERWIPVTEKLPTENNSYLVWMPFAPEGHHITVAEWRGNYWNIKTPITAWQPLPTPYREGDKMACNQCKFYSEFTEPRDLSIAGEKYANAVCYGMCYKQKNAHGNYQGYPVYIPEGNCKDFARRRGIRQRDVTLDGQYKLQLMEGGQDE